MRAVLFDLDQTLLDRDSSLHAFLRWQCANTLKPHLKAPASFISRFIDLDDNGKVWKDNVYTQLIEEFNIPDLTPQELLTEYTDKFCQFTNPRPGIPEVIESLSGTHRLGLITNGPSPFQEQNFHSLGFSSHFESIIVSEAVGLRKPDPAIFLLACSELDVSPAEAIYIGDNPESDIRGAQNAGLKTIFIPTAQHPTCPIADITINESSELPNAIKNLTSDY